MAYLIHDYCKYFVASSSNAASPPLDYTSDKEVVVEDVKPKKVPQDAQTVNNFIERVFLITINAGMLNCFLVNV